MHVCEETGWDIEELEETVSIDKTRLGIVPVLTTRVKKNKSHGIEYLGDLFGGGKISLRLDVFLVPLNKALMKDQIVSK